MKLFEAIDPMNPQKNNYVELLMEMDQHDIKQRDVVDVKDFIKSYEKVTDVKPYDKKTDPIRFHRHNMKRDPLFKHEIFGNNYRMFGLEKPFDINELPWR